MEKIRYVNKKPSVWKRAFSTYKRRRYFRKFSLNKNPRYQEIKARGEYMDALYVPGLGNTYLHQNNGFQYMNFYNCINFMSSLTGMMTEFELYKIDGVSVEIMPCVDSYGVTFTYGAPACAVGVNPVETSNTLGITAFTNDTSVTCYLNQRMPVRKYISYPFNYFNGVTLGVGTWNRTDNFSSQVGEFCTYMPDTNTNTSGSNTYCFNVKYQIYCSFKQRAK